MKDIKTMPGDGGWWVGFEVIFTFFVWSKPKV